MKIIAMSDLHLSKKPWKVRKSLTMAQVADAVLMIGDLVNDGTPEQFELMRKCISEVLPDTPVFAAAGNHDYDEEQYEQADRDWISLGVGPKGYIVRLDARFHDSTRKFSFKWRWTKE